MKRYFVFLSYNGSNYCGWQNQSNGISVQQKLEESLGLLLREPIGVTGAGRTDAGVHARLMVAHFDWEGSDFVPEYLAEKLNRLLPHDIAIQKIMQVSPAAHARFDAVSRTYEYHISFQKNPFYHLYQLKVGFALDFEKMNEAAAILTEYTDFTSFSKLHTDVKTNNCRVMKSVWTQEGDAWVFTIRANRFLRNMVRSIVGTLLDIGRGKLDLNDFRRIIEAKDRGKAGTSAPAKALFLTDIEYPASVFILTDI
jgi:tRNA pseudouridine38-40 synthase